MRVGICYLAGACCCCTAAAVLTGAVVLLPLLYCCCCTAAAVLLLPLLPTADESIMIYLDIACTVGLVIETDAHPC